MKWFAKAPSNIALIKYMGKTQQDINLPANPSLSYTLNHLLSFVELELRRDLTEDQWQPLEIAGALPAPLSAQAQRRYLNHLKLIKRRFNINEYFIVRSANNFPASCGIASSASSFAALTLCAVNAFTELTQAQPLSLHEVAALSRAGSGSSCRSLAGPWVLWRQDSIETPDLSYSSLRHRVVVVSKEVKSIASSEAHRRVSTSLLYQQRSARAQQRLNYLLEAFAQKNWHLAYTLVWQEFWDMHALFETSDQPFGYLQPATLQVLDYLRSYWENNGDGPLVTLDAGPNVHLLFRDDQSRQVEVIENALGGQFSIL